MIVPFLILMNLVILYISQSVSWCMACGLAAQVRSAQFVDVHK